MAFKFSELFEALEGKDQKSINFLSSAIERNNLKGFDYIEFKRSLKAMKDMNLDSTTAIKSAFATASTMGLTKDRLLHSIQHYKNVLSKEKSQFDDALKKQIDNRIRSKQEEKINLREQIVILNKRITEIENKIANFQDKVDNSDAEIEAAERKIKETKLNFEEVYTEFVQHMDADLESFNNII
jgi:peptidoglycan hydrolase CwlO-like protein